MKSYKKDFELMKKEWESVGFTFFDTLYDADIQVGDKVMFTNDVGIIFGPYEVLAFQKPGPDGRCVFIDHDCYWLPVTLESLRQCGKEKVGR